MLAWLIGAADPESSALAVDAGTVMKDTAVAVVVSVAPMAVAVLLAWSAFGWAAKLLGFSDPSSDRYRDKHFKSGELWDSESGNYAGKNERGYYLRKAGSTRRRYDKAGI